MTADRYTYSEDGTIAYLCCVRCPYCNKTVTAVIQNEMIECPECGVKKEWKESV